jgi:hypothetical protein
MVKDLNRFSVSGVVTVAPEVIRLRSGMMMAKFAVIVADEFANGRPRFHRLALAVFDKPAEVAASLKPGDRVVVEGAFDTFCGVSATGKPFARITFKALAVERVESPTPAPAPAEERPMGWMARSVEDLFLELSPAERDVLARAVPRIQAPHAPSRTQVMTPDAVS